MPASWAELWNRIAPERSLPQPSQCPPKESDSDPDTDSLYWDSGDSEHEPIQDGPPKSPKSDPEPKSDPDTDSLYWDSGDSEHEPIQYGPPKSPKSGNGSSPHSGAKSADDADADADDRDASSGRGPNHGSVSGGSSNDDKNSDHDCHSDSDCVQGDGPSGDDHDEDDEDDEDEDESSESESDASGLERRRAQTKKAREAAVAAKMLRRLAKQVSVELPDKHSSYLPSLKGADSNLTGAGQHFKPYSKKRRRLLYSWFKAACDFLNNFFRDQQCHHVLSISVIDDTNMQLSTSMTPQWQTSRTVTVLNNVQTCVACFDSMDECGEKYCDYKSFPLHTPPSALPRANAQNILQEFQSWLFSEVGSGTRWEHFGLRSDLLSGVPFICSVTCFDSLSTNIRLMKMMRRAAFWKQKQQQEQQVPGNLLVGFVCGIHQLALARKTLLFHHGGFWASIVRLSHLFEAQNFRTQFRSALFGVIIDSFVHIPVQAMPTGHREWKAERMRLCNLISQGEEPNPARLRFHQALMKWDNGDSNSESISHWCTGDCCQGLTPAQKSEYCLAMLCKHFHYLFSFGYGVPLTYRWKHSAPALRYCADAWCVLSKTEATLSHRNITRIKSKRTIFHIRIIPWIMNHWIIKSLSYQRIESLSIIWIIIISHT